MPVVQLDCFPCCFSLPIRKGRINESPNTPPRPAARRLPAPLRGELRALGDDLVRPLRARTIKDASWANAWKRHFPVLRIGRRLVVRPFPLLLLRLYPCLPKA